MFTKKHLVLTAVVTFAITILTCVSGMFLYTAKQPADLTAQAKALITEHYVDPLTEEQVKKMDDYAISAMVASLEDPYSYYFDAETYDTFEENNQEEYVGVGVTVSFQGDKNQLTVIAPTDGSPAQKAGILPGDVIVRVDDLTVTAESYQDVIDHIKGDNAKKGSVVTLTILRGGQELTIPVTRDVIPLDTVSYKMLDEQVGYVRISEFKHGTVDEFSEALSEIKKKNANGLVIDLRSNPGGYADSVLRMTDMLLPKGVIAYLENNKGEKEYFYSDAKHLEIPMTILVNQGTASAAELMAGSAQAYGAATIVGKKTYGKAVGQTPIMLTEDTAIYLTSARYYTPKGECIDKKGIQPDIDVDLSRELLGRLTELTLAEDDQLRTAVEILYNQIKR